LGAIKPKGINRPKHCKCTVGPWYIDLEQIVTLDISKYNYVPVIVY